MLILDFLNKHDCRIRKELLSEQLSHPLWHTQLGGLLKGTIFLYLVVI